MMKKLISTLLLCTFLLSVLTPFALAVEKTEGTEFEHTEANASEPVNTDAADTRAAAAWDSDGDGTLSLLAIGNSFSVDGLEYFYDIAKSLGISKIVLGNLYIGGCSLATHYSNAKADSASYTYYFNNSGSWTTTKSYKMSTAIKSRSWDFISMQQNSGNSGLESTYNSNLTNLISYVKGKMTSDKTRLVWHMTWAYQGNSTHSSFSNYNNNQTTMYNGIITAVTNKILTNSNFDRVVPNGTAVQNMRSSVVGDTITRDGYHMSYDIGRFVTGLMFVKTITGLDIKKNTYIPTGVSDTIAYIAADAVTRAYSAPMKVTKSQYTGNDFKSNFIQLIPSLKKSSYWHSNSTNYNVQITNTDISNRYFCTPRFTKEELPVGSVILCKSGWQYRPEGWVTDAKQSSREGVVSDKIIVVTEKWWKNYTLRAFNISKTDNSDISSMSAADILTNFRIFVPESIYLKNHVRIYPQLTKCGYWHPLNATGWKTPVTNASNSPNFFCTPKFDKTALPVGSVITVKSGWQYRPDGWLTDAQQTGTREVVTSRYSQIVTSGWWGKYTIRAFNISTTAGDSLSAKTQADIDNVFKIYVPRSKHTHTPTSVVTAPTCTTGGYTTYTCTLCREVYTGAQTAALGHNYTSVVTAPTCTEAGYTTFSCTRCNETTVGEATPALGHSYTSVVTAPTCTEAGYTTFSCTRCNEKTVGEATPALGHHHVYTVIDAMEHSVACDRCTYTVTEVHCYSEGVCICGQPEIIEPVLSESLKISHTLNLASDISVNLVVPKTLLEGYDLATVYMLSEIDSYDGNSQIGSQIITLHPVDNGNFYYFTIEGLTAVRMNDKIRSVLHGVKNGRPYYSAVDVYCIADYAYSQLHKANTPDTLKRLCADLLRYGSAAQSYKNYRTDCFADSSMTEDDTNYLSDLSAVAFHTVNEVIKTPETPSIQWVGKTLELNSKVALKFVFDLGSYTGAVEDLTLRVSYTDRSGNVKEVSISNAEPYASVAGRYSFSFDGLLAAELRTVVTVQIFGGDAPLSYSLRYSADTYGNGKTNALGTLCKALFAYSDSANAYFPAN